MTSPAQPEPWLRGRMTDLPAVLLAVLHALELTNEDANRWCGSLSETEIHARPSSLPSVAFHLRHIARSVDRLMTYAEGNSLSKQQLAALSSEMEPVGSPQSILDELSASLQNATIRIYNFQSTSLEQSRTVGRQQLPTTFAGLLVHIADHTQRHTGQAITTAKLLLALRQQKPPI